MMSVKERTRAVRLRERINLRRFNLGAPWFIEESLACGWFGGCQRRIGMLMPGDAFVRDLRMPAQEIERVGGRRRIDPLDGIQRCFFFRLLLVTHSAIENGEVV